MLTNKEAKEKVEKLLDLSMSKVSSWELDFITDMQDLEDFTDAQLEKIEELGGKYL